MHAPATCNCKRVITKVFGGLDVVLVVICPIEFDLLALVRDGVYPLLVTTQRKKIAFVVIAAKEAIKVRKDFAFDSFDIGFLRKLLAQLLDLGQRFGVCSQVPSLLDGLLNSASIAARSACSNSPRASRTCGNRSRSRKRVISSRFAFMIR